MENRVAGGPQTPLLAIIGGSGIYDIDGLEDIRWAEVATPFGKPSDALLHGSLNGQPLIFLPRHGRGHKTLPSDINFRANIDALKRVGVTDIIAMSAVGSLREDLSPGDFVLIDQFIDCSFARPKTFFGDGLAAHVSMARPVCSRLGDALEAAADEAGIKILRGGSYLVMEGPQFSTLAESNLYRSWGCNVVGMTNMPEAKLAREAEICYAAVAMVTDFDCWHPDHDDVTVGNVVAVLKDNADKGRNLVKHAAPRLAGHRGPCVKGCQTALDTAVITAPGARDPAMVEKLDAIAGRVLKAGI